jgi:DNA-binding winged helix-turn-helix (wHTH) protein
MVVKELPELTALLPRLKAVLSDILTDRCNTAPAPVDGKVEILPEDFAYNLLILDMGWLDLANTCPAVCQQVRFDQADSTQTEPLHKSKPLPCQRPLLLLTNRNCSLGIKAGADSSIVKVFHGEELEALLQTLFRSSSTNTSPLLEWGELQLNPQDYRVMYHSTPIDLTPKEYEILELLMRNDRQVYSCKNILENLWDRQEAPSEEAVRTHIKCLRRKLKAAGADPDFVETVYGFGYRLKSLSSQDPQTVSLI